MDFKSIPWWIWAIPSALLIIAIARLPYGYYTFLRIVVCTGAAIFAYAAWNTGRRLGQALAVLFALFAVLFNPIVPVRLSRGEWYYLNIAGAGLFALGALFAMLQRRR